MKDEFNIENIEKLIKSVDMIKEKVRTYKKHMPEQVFSSYQHKASDKVASIIEQLRNSPSDFRKILQDETKGEARVIQDLIYYILADVLTLGKIGADDL